MLYNRLSTQRLLMRAEEGEKRREEEKRKKHRLDYTTIILNREIIQIQSSLQLMTGSSVLYLCVHEDSSTGMVSP